MDDRAGAMRRRPRASAHLPCPPRVALGFAAVAMTVLSFGAMVVLPSELESVPAAGAPVASIRG